MFHISLDVVPVPGSENPVEAKRFDD